MLVLHRLETPKPYDTRFRVEGGRLTAVIADANNTGTSFTYDTAGRVIRQVVGTDSTTYEYDHGRLVREHLTETHDTGVPEQPSYTLETIASYSYDRRGRLTNVAKTPTTPSVQIPGAAVSVDRPTRTFAFTFDDHDRIAAVEERYGESRRLVKFRYDDAGRLVEETDESDKTNTSTRVYTYSCPSN